MHKKLRHSKFKNTGILFEILTRQITADIIAGKDESEAKTLLFKYFNENTILGKEWQLYSFLINESVKEKIKDQLQADRFMMVVLEQRKKLNSKQLLEQKYNLIKEIKNLYPIEEFLKTNVKNYKLLASIYKLFEDVSCCDDVKFDVKEIYQAKNCIIEHVLDKKSLIPEKEDTIKLYEKQTEDIRLLSYKLFVEAFNKKYSGILDDNQKEVLREYIYNVANTNALPEFVLNKITFLKKELAEISTKIKDSEVIKIKINEVAKQLDNIKPNKIVKDNHIMVLLLSYELLKECKQILNIK